MALEIVSFAIRNGGSFHIYVTAVYLRRIMGDDDMFKSFKMTTGFMKIGDHGGGMIILLESFE